MGARPIEAAGTSTAAFVGEAPNPDARVNQAVAINDWSSFVREFAPAYAWIESHTPPEARIFILGENRTYDLDRHTIAAGNLDGPRIAAWFAQFPNAEALRTELRRQHVTHILIHPAWMRPPKTMMEREYTLDLPPQSDAVLRAMLRDSTPLVYRDKGYLLFAVTPLRSDRR